MNSEAFCELLRKSLLSRQISITAWARRVGISQGYASNLCTGRRNPALEQIDAWADDLGLTGDARRHFWNAAILCHLPKAAFPRMVELIRADELASAAVLASDGTSRATVPTGHDPDTKVS
jgi:transcriptional regulator with XRE-family HTH domain